MKRLKSIEVPVVPREGTARAVAVMALEQSIGKTREEVLHALHVAECSWRLMTKGGVPTPPSQRPAGWLKTYSAVFS